jgi:hypothetical protein
MRPPDRKEAVMRDRGRGAATSRYRIVVREEFGDILSAAFPGISVEPGEGRTVLTVTVEDEQELYGIVDRLRDFAVSIVSISEMEGNGAQGPSPSQQPP